MHRKSLGSPDLQGHAYYYNDEAVENGIDSARNYENVIAGDTMRRDLPVPKAVYRLTL